jgi:hypothetical protein
MHIHRTKGFIKKGQKLSEDEKKTAGMKKQFRNVILAFARGIGLMHKEKIQAYRANTIRSSEFRYKVIACLFVDCFYPEGVIDPIPNVFNLMTKFHADMDPAKTQTILACLDFIDEDATVQITDEDIMQQLQLGDRSENEDVKLLTTKDVIKLINDTTKNSSNYNK